MQIQIYPPGQVTPADLREIRQLIGAAMYHSWESGVASGEGDSDRMRHFNERVAANRAELFSRLGIA